MLVPINADLAHAEGFTGKGVRIGFVDYFMNGADDINEYSPLEGALDFFSKGSFPYGDEDHGLHVAAAALGRPVKGFKGGVAPDARLYAKQGSDPDDLIDMGIRILNSSTSLNITGKLINHRGLLVVVANGNEGQDNPGSLGTAPRYSRFELRDKWISVSSVYVDEKGNPIPAEYTNKCGVAAEWCISAPSLQRIPLTKIADPGWQAFGYMETDGTSIASPIVAGVAALVMEAYPWMTASNIQQTVLTTATDIGAPGVDPIYGWGLVNARKAIDGPAQLYKTKKHYVYFLREKQADGIYSMDEISEDEFDENYRHLPYNDGKTKEWFNNPTGDELPNAFIVSTYREEGDGIFTANVEGSSRPFFNDISGEGGLWKLGSGTLTLAGNNTYKGGTFVEAGTLISSGSFGSDVEVQPGATFRTSGTGVTINGDYDAYSATDWNDGLPEFEWKSGVATTAIQIGAPLTVTGKADVSDTRLLLLPEVQGYTVKATETLISTGEGLYGRFGEVTYGNSFFWNTALNYGEKILTANLTRASAQAQAMAINAPQKVIDGAGAADMLIEYTDDLVNRGQVAGNEAILSVTAKLMSAASDAAAALSLSSLTGDIHGTARALGVQRSLGEGERLADRLRTLREAGMWVNSNSRNGHLNRVGYGAAEVHHSTYGFGADHKVGVAWTVGLAASQTKSTANLDALGGRLTGSGQQMAVYGRRAMGRYGYFTGLLSHDRHMVDTQRQVLTGHTLHHVVGQHTDSATLVRLESGLRLNGGLSPYLAAGTIRLRQGGFTESGTLGLSAEANTLSTHFLDIGSRWDHQVGRWTFAGTLSARQMLGHDGGFSAAFAGADAARFIVNAPPLARNSIRFGSDVGYRTRNGWHLSLGMGVDQGSGQRSNVWSEAMLRLGF